MAIYLIYCSHGTVTIADDVMDDVCMRMVRILDLDAIRITRHEYCLFFFP